MMMSATFMKKTRYDPATKRSGLVLGSDHCAVPAHNNMGLINERMASSAHPTDCERPVTSISRPAA